MTLKDRYYAVLDAWDKFKESPLKTHGACVIAGVIIGVALAYR